MNSINNYSLDNLTGKFLIASPHCFFSDIFNKSLIYITSHNAEEGAVGLIINRLVNKVPFHSVMTMLKNESINLDSSSLSVFMGGPVEPERGFILHTAEYNKNLLLHCPNNLAVSSNLEILKAISDGSGPEKSLFVLGYTGWEKGQLDQEMFNNMWIVADYDSDIMFLADHEKKWQSALKNIGVDNSLFAAGAGHC